MRRKNKNKQGLHYDNRDVRDLKYKKEIFDLIVDKATMDTVLCNEKGLLDVTIMTKEISRVLRTDGIYLILSFGKPEDRIIHLQREHLSFEIKICEITKNHLKKGNNNNQVEENGDLNENIGNKSIHYAYVCRKLPDANEKLQNFDMVYAKLEEFVKKEKGNNSNENNENSTNNTTETNNKNKNNEKDNNNDENEKSEIVLNINEE